MADKETYYFDATAARTTHCGLKTLLSVVFGYRSKLTSADIEFGSAFHKFRKIMRETGGNYNLAVAAAIEHMETHKNCFVKKHKQKLMTKQYLLKVCLDYWEHWAPDTFKVLRADPDLNIHTGFEGKPMFLEVKFDLDFYEDDDIKIVLCGTIDEIGKFDGGCYAIADAKTTGSYNDKEFFKDFELSSQLMMYSWVIREYKRRFPENPLSQLNYQIGAFIDGIFLGSEEEGAEFHRSEVFFFKDAQLDEYERLMKEAIFKLIHNTKQLPILPAREGMFNGTCQGKYGRCEYWAACCMAHDPVSRELILKHHLKQVKYEPLKFGE